MDKLNLYGILAGIVGAVFAYISYLRSKNTQLGDKVGMLQAESSIREKLLKKEDAENEANSEEDRYRALRNNYLNNSGDGSDDKGPVH